MRFSCLLIFILFPFIAFSQSNYHEGYVLKNNGDTIQGYINVHDWARTPETIEFKAEKSMLQASKFGPADIQGFYIMPGLNYLSYTGKLSNNRNAFPDIDNRLDTTTTTGSIFLKQILNSNNVSLYANTDNIKSRYFYCEQGQQPVELKYYNYHTADNNNTATNKTYVGQILALMSKYERYNDRNKAIAEQTAFSESGLRESFELINNAKVAKGPKLSNARLFIGLGLNYTTTKFTGDTRFAKSEGAKTYLPKISMGYDVFVNPIVQRFVLRGEVSFSYINPTIEGYSIGSLNKNVTDRYSFDQYTVTLAPQMLFNIYNKERFKFFVGAGIGFNLSQYANNKITLGQGSQYDDETYKLRSFWANFPLQAGVVVNKSFEVNIVYIPPSNYVNSLQFSLQNQVVGVGIKYLFNKN
ncbi:MAG: hypothetical protein EOO47_23575 [Flavobacterium sp.]|nr:MAG: hypothetical protein EOO47_23575 [Flavobacterium sp.]